MTSPRVPQNITATRHPDGTFAVTVDGRPFPYQVSAVDPVSVDVIRGQRPQLRLSLAARSVVIVDEYLSDLPDDDLVADLPCTDDCPVLDGEGTCVAGAGCGRGLSFE